MQAIVLKPLGDGVAIGDVTDVPNPRRYNQLTQQNKIAPVPVKKGGRPKKTDEGPEVKQNDEFSDEG